MNLDYNKYNVKMQPEYIRIANVKGAVTSSPARPKGFEALCDKDGFPNKDEVDFSEWLRSVQVYREQVEKFEQFKKAVLKIEADCITRFKKDLFEELGISKNPKREALFGKAWENCHHAGLPEVASCASDLVDLVS